MRHEILSHVFFCIFLFLLRKNNYKKKKGGWKRMTLQDYMLKEDIKMTALEGTQIVIANKKIVFGNDMDIILTPTVKSIVRDNKAVDRLIRSR